MTRFALEEFGVRNVGTRVMDADGNDVRGRVYSRNDYAEYILPKGALGKGLPQTEHVMHIRGVDVEACAGRRFS